MPFGVVTYMSNRSIATRSHRWPTSRCPMGAVAGKETSGPDKTYMMPGKNEHPDPKWPPGILTDVSCNTVAEKGEGLGWHSCMPAHASSVPPGHTPVQSDPQYVPEKPLPFAWKVHFLALAILDEDTGMFRKLNIYEIICNLCNINAVEDETHFILYCRRYTEERQ